MQVSLSEPKHKENLPKKLLHDLFLTSYLTSCRTAPPDLQKAAKV